jgi:hypothetical protein
MATTFVCVPCKEGQHGADDGEGFCSCCQDTLIERNCQHCGNDPVEQDKFDGLLCQYHLDEALGEFYAEFMMCRDDR